VSAPPDVEVAPNGSPPASADQGPGVGARIAQAGESRSARIESLRALASLCVVGAHAFLYSYVSATITHSYGHRVILEVGFGSLDVFFVLSGYLLFWPFARSSFATGEKVDLRHYALNRVVRILPLYYSVLIVMLVLQNHGGTPGEWWRFGLFVENFSSKTLYAIDSPMWSLAVEVQFYALLPFIALFVARLARGSRHAAIGILSIGAIASFVLRQVVYWHGHPPNTALQSSIPTLFSFFAAGMILALLRVGWMEKPPRWLRGVGGSSTAWFLCSLPLWAIVAWHFSYEPAAALAAALIVGACVLPLRRGPFVALTELRVLSRIGVATYSLYLWHVPILLAIDNRSVTSTAFSGAVPTTAHFLKLYVLGAVISVLVALVSYRVIEEPALRLRRRWSRSSAPSVGSPAAE